MQIVMIVFSTVLHSTVLKYTSTAMAAAASKSSVWRLSFSFMQLRVKSEDVGCRFQEWDSVLC